MRAARAEIFFLLLLVGCGAAVQRPTPTPSGLPAVFQRGKASFYDNSAGRQTASGERFDETKLTAAHRTLPFGTIVLVTNEKNGLAVEVRVNDRGPFTGGRIIDLSKEAARRLRMLDDGVVEVTIRVVKRGK